MSNELASAIITSKPLAYLLLFLIALEAAPIARPSKAEIKSLSVFLIALLYLGENPFSMSFSRILKIKMRLSRIEWIILSWSLFLVSAKPLSRT